MVALLKSYGANPDIYDSMYTKAEDYRYLLNDPPAPLYPATLKYIKVYNPRSTKGYVDLWPIAQFEGQFKVKFCTREIGGNEYVSNLVSPVLDDLSGELVVNEIEINPDTIKKYVDETKMPAQRCISNSSGDENLILACISRRASIGDIGDSIGSCIGGSIGDQSFFCSPRIAWATEETLIPNRISFITLSLYFGAY
jgi:hypothetical protein